LVVVQAARLEVLLREIGKEVTTVRLETVLARPRLSDSLKHPGDPKGCNHVLVRRGNQHASWYACRGCPARWPRESGEGLEA
jgi:hypothetical protein